MTFLRGEDDGRAGRLCLGRPLDVSAAASKMPHAMATRVFPGDVPQEIDLGSDGDAVMDQ